MVKVRPIGKSVNKNFPTRSELPSTFSLVKVEVVRVMTPSVAVIVTTLLSAKKVVVTVPPRVVTSGDRESTTSFC